MMMDDVDWRGEYIVNCEVIKCLSGVSRILENYLCD